jgi:hypothetical protein
MTEQRKRAMAYLEASGAAAITIIEPDGVCTISAGAGQAKKNSQPGNSFRVAARWWIAEQDAARVARAARQCAGVVSSDSALSSTLGAVVTPDDIAIERAAAAAVIRLDSMIDAMRRDGTLQEFNARYKRGCAAAAARGEGYMNFGVAMARFKRALIPMLQSGKPMRGVFDEVFR